MFSFFTSFLSALAVVPQLLTVIDQVVVNVETGIGQVAGIGGSQKLAAAEAKVNSFLADAVSDVKILSGVEVLVKPLINGAVAAFNAAGIFKHKTASNGTATPSATS